MNQFFLFSFFKKIDKIFRPREEINHMNEDDSNNEIDSHTELFLIIPAAGILLSIFLKQGFIFTIVCTVSTFIACRIHANENLDPYDAIVAQIIFGWICTIVASLIVLYLSIFFSAIIGLI